MNGRGGVYNYSGDGDGFVATHSRLCLFASESDRNTTTFADVTMVSCSQPPIQSYGLVDRCQPPILSSGLTTMVAPTVTLAHNILDQEVWLLLLLLLL